MDHPPGTRIADRYTVEAQLGAGGMGVVLRAKDERLERTVALKVLSARGLGDAQATARLIREAKATAALEHPHIVPIYDVGPTGDGGAYLAMQLVKGETLRSRLAREGKLPLDETLRIVSETGAGLAFAHDAGVIHRDIKPDNVMLRADDDRVVVLDFGLAKRLGSEDAEMFTLTAEGSIVGTPAYLSPEQARGETLDGRTDQFALAVIAYELLTGSIPWRGSTLTALLASVMTDEVPPLAESVAAPPAVSDAIARALSKDRAARFETVTHFLEALGVPADAPQTPRPAAATSSSSVAFAETLASGEAASPPGETQETHATPRPARQRAFVGAALVLAALGAAGWFASTRLDVAGDAAEDADPGAGADVAPVTLTDLPPPVGCSDEARAHHQHGIRLIHSGNWGEGCAAFRAATEADPSCASAQLRLANCAAGADTGRETARTAFRQATLYQEKLSEREAALREALAPLFNEGLPDRIAYARALATLPERFPDDAELLVFAADQSNAPLTRRIDWARRAVALDRSYSDAYQILARRLLEDGERDEARDALEACQDNVELTTDCLTQELLMLRDEGRCREVLDRMELVRARGAGFQVTAFQAHVEAAIGRPEEDVRRTIEAVGRGEDETPELVRERTLLRLGLASLFGKLDEVIADATNPETGADGNEGMTTVRTYAAVEAMTELGRTDEAARLAASAVLEWRGETGAIRNFAGMIVVNRSLLEAARPALDAEMHRELSERLRRLETDESFVAEADGWAGRTALSVTDRQSAIAALEALSAEPPRYGEPSTVGLAGRVLLLAGRPEEAIGRLELFARGCTVLVQPFLTTRALVWLGDAHEASGDHEAACAAYRDVITRWGDNAPTARTVREARQRLSACEE